MCFRFLSACTDFGVVPATYRRSRYVSAASGNGLAAVLLDTSMPNLSFLKAPDAGRPQQHIGAVAQVQATIRDGKLARLVRMRHAAGFQHVQRAAMAAA